MATSANLLHRALPTRILRLVDRVEPFGWLLWVSVLAFLARAVLIPDALFMSDEYYYVKTSQLWFLDQEQIRGITGIPGRGEPGFPNSLFFAVYQWTFLFGDSFYTAAKMFNVFFLTAGAFAIRSVAKHFTSVRTAGWIGVLSLWLPSASYASYFLTDAMYECLVWLGLAAFFALIDRKLWVACAASAALWGAAFVTKPTALMILVAANVVVVVTAWRRAYDGLDSYRSLGMALVTLNGAFSLTGLLLNALSTGTLAWDPVGEFYRFGMSRSLDINTEVLRVLVNYGLAYTFAVALIFGPALVILASSMTTPVRAGRETALIAFSAVGLVILLTLSAKSAANWDFVYEGHRNVFSTRYMAVLFPLLIVVFTSRFEAATTTTRMRSWTGIVILLAAGVLAVLYGRMENSIQFREVFWTKGLGQLGLAAFVAQVLAFLSLTAYYAFASSPRRLPYGTLIGVWSAAAAFGLWQLDRNASSWAGSYGSAARTVASLVHAEDQNRGLVISDSRAKSALFMLRYPGFVPTTLAEPRSEIVSREIPAETKWVVYLWDSRPSVRSQCIEMRAATYCRVAEDGDRF